MHIHTAVSDHQPALSRCPSCHTCRVVVQRTQPSRQQKLDLVQEAVIGGAEPRGSGRHPACGDSGGWNSRRPCSTCRPFLRRSLSASQKPEQARPRHTSRWWDEPALPFPHWLVEAKRGGAEQLTFALLGNSP